ncbi:MAG: hypothetical protein J0M11_18555 [Anaerolineae bacterium]|nr:hypothetical protein [Anaerolineae bacterium]
MQNNEVTQEKSMRKIEGFVSLISGIISIVLFSVQYPFWSFLFIPIYIATGYLYFQNDINTIIKEVQQTSQPKILYWGKSIWNNRTALIFITLGIVIFANLFNFTAKETYYIYRQGWVEEISFNNVDFGVENLYLVTLDQSQRSLEGLRKINPVIYFGENIFLDSTISFETTDIDIGNDFFSDTNIDIEVTGLDPENEFLQPTGNFTPNRDETGYKKFPIKNNYTIFVHVNNCKSGSCYFRLHIKLKDGALGIYSNPKSIEITISHLENDTNRFNGLIKP